MRGPTKRTKFLGQGGARWLPASAQASAQCCSVYLVRAEIGKSKIVFFIFVFFGLGLHYICFFVLGSCVVFHGQVLFDVSEHIFSTSYNFGGRVHVTVQRVAKKPAGLEKDLVQTNLGWLHALHASTKDADAMFKAGLTCASSAQYDVCACAYERASAHFRGFCCGLSF